MSDESGFQNSILARLGFACACASAVKVVDDPRSPVARAGTLNDGTRELILKAVSRRPRTTAQLAQLLGLSAPAVHRHMTELPASELIREVEVRPEERGSDLGTRNIPLIARCSLLKEDRHGE